jgi:hypothetical protein
MRAVILAFVVGVALAAGSAQAAPFSSKPRVIKSSPAPSAELVAQDCGHGWHRQHWRDHWGHWHWGHCVPYVDGAHKVRTPLFRLARSHRGLW